MPRLHIGYWCQYCGVCGRFWASVIGSRLRFFRNPRDFPFLVQKEGMREATASRAADLAVGVMGAQQRLPRSFLSPVPVLPTSANLVAETVYALTTHRSYCRRAGCPGPRDDFGTSPHRRETAPAPPGSPS